MMEILSPAGSPEAVRAAVYAGADAVYLGYGPFNARRNARNFSREELEEAIRLCHLYGVKVYLTLNTLASDREVAQAAQVAVEASSLGVDAILVQDMGLLQVVGQVAPDVHLHASTQMTIHNLDGVKRCADLGLTRAVLFLVCFIAVLAAWTLLSRALDLAFRLPVLSTLNQWSGAAVGLVKGGVLLFIACWLFRGLIPQEAVDQSILLRFFCTTNPFLLIASIF